MLVLLRYRQIKKLRQKLVIVIKANRIRDAIKHIHTYLIHITNEYIDSSFLFAQRGNNGFMFIGNIVS